MQNLEEAAATEWSLMEPSSILANSHNNMRDMASCKHRTGNLPVVCFIKEATGDPGHMQTPNLLFYTAHEASFDQTPEIG